MKNINIRLNKIFLRIGICLLTGTFGTLSAQQIQEVLLWPDGTKDSNGITEKEIHENGCVRNVSVASIKIYSANKDKNTGIAVLICPGGGYVVEAEMHEGIHFAEELVNQGITGVVLKYRLPNKHPQIPLEDVKQAVRILRAQAADWNIDPQKIGVAGFSAGGHLASTLLTHFDQSSRPDFGILYYPVISMKDGITHTGSRANLLGEENNEELNLQYSNEDCVSKDTPPTLLLLSDDDSVVVPENSILFYQALKKNNIPASIHIFPEGGHGWGYNSSFRYHETMKMLVLDWLKR